VREHEGLVAVGTSDDAVYLGTMDKTQEPPDVQWADLPARITRLSFASDGLLVAASTTGAVWIASPSRVKWLYRYWPEQSGMGHQLVTMVTSRPHWIQVAGCFGLTFRRCAMFCTNQHSLF